ncbi:helix-turn-helix transcriptional regulator [Chitinimonas naiadis]
MTASQRIIRLPEVMNLLGVSRASVYNFMAREGFPKQIKLGRIVGWVESEVQDWIKGKIDASRQGSSNDPQHQQAA